MRTKLSFFRHGQSTTERMEKENTETTNRLERKLLGFSTIFPCRKSSFPFQSEFVIRCGWKRNLLSFPLSREQNFREHDGVISLKSNRCCFYTSRTAEKFNAIILIELIRILTFPAGGAKNLTFCNFSSCLIFVKRKSFQKS